MTGLDIWAVVTAIYALGVGVVAIICVFIYVQKEMQAERAAKAEEKRKDDADE